MKLLELRKYAEKNPLVQRQAHEKTSAKYNQVRTQDILNHFELNGWYESSVQVVNSKKYAGYQKHLVRLRNDAFMIGDDHIEIVLTNSHMGNSSLVLQIGIFRLVCSNGMILGETFFKRRIRHAGFTYKLLDDAIQQIELRMPKIQEIVCKMKDIVLDHEQKTALAAVVMSKRMKDIEHKGIFHHQVDMRRHEDRENSLWVYMNRLQEMVIRGGIRYLRGQKHYTGRVFNDGKREYYTTTVKAYSKPVKSIDKIVKLNEFIFDEAAKLAA